jgi:hypothetical protein
MTAPHHLTDALDAAVPLHIDEMRTWKPRHRADEAHCLAQVITEKGDVLQYGGQRGEAARTFTALARGLAAAAYQPGGVTFAGRHWCVEAHIACPARPAEAFRKAS